MIAETRRRCLRCPRHCPRLSPLLRNQVSWGEKPLRDSNASAIAQHAHKIVLRDIILRDTYWRHHAPLHIDRHISGSPTCWPYDCLLSCCFSPCHRKKARELRNTFVWSKNACLKPSSNASMPLPGFMSPRYRGAFCEWVNIPNITKRAIKVKWLI